MITLRDVYDNVVTHYSELMGDDDNFGMYDRDGYECNDAGRRRGEDDDTFFNRTNQHPGDFDADVGRCGIRQNNANANGFFDTILNVFNGYDRGTESGTMQNDAIPHRPVKERTSDVMDTVTMVASVAITVIGVLGALYTEYQKNK